MADTTNTEEQQKAEADAKALADAASREAIEKKDEPIAPASDPEKDALKQKVASYEFSEKINEVSKTYPHASQFKDDIQKLVQEKGYSIEDASLVVLNKAGKMQTAEQIVREQNRGGSSGFGGSMDNPPPRDKKDPVPGEAGSAEFYANRFKELEAKGEIRIV